MSISVCTVVHHPRGNESYLRTWSKILLPIIERTIPPRANMIGPRLTNGQSALIILTKNETNKQPATCGSPNTTKYI